MHSICTLFWPGPLVVPRNIFAMPAPRPFSASLLSSWEIFSRLSKPFDVLCCLARSQCNSQCWCGRALLQLPCINCCAFRIWTASFRIGEALHPGPCTSLQAGDCVKVAIVNPTAVHRKEADLSSLQAHVLCLISETSAIDAVQAAFARNMASRGYRSYFGAAVAPHSVDAVGPGMVRGAAGGVAICVTLPSRLSPEPICPEVWATTRIVESFVRFAALEVRIITLYGVPSAHEDSKSANQYLHTAVLRRLSASKVPTLVAGDLNVRVQSLPVWEEYCKLGFHEIHELVPVRLGLHLPATCKGATHHDTALLNEPLLGLLQHAVVLEQDFLFDAHSPLLLHFRCPDGLPLRKRWRQPQSWLDFDIQADSFSQAYSEVAPQVEAALDTVTSLDAAPDAFAFWADRVEHSVHSAIQAQHRADPLAFPCNKLPRRCRGRCRPVKLVGRPCPQLARAPRCGDYTPAFEATSILVRMRTRQVHRIRSLLGGVRKAESQSLPADSFIQHLLNQWGAVLRAPGYGRDFTTWLLSWPFVTWMPVDWPTSDWLFEALQLVEFDCTAVACQETRLRKQAFALTVQLDEQHESHRMGCRALRGPAKAPLTVVPSTQSQPAAVLAVDALGEVQLQVPRPLAYRCGFPASFAGAEGTVVCTDASSVHVAFGASLSTCQGTLSQTVHLCTAEELHDGFAAYWADFWHRDTAHEATHEAAWPAFQHILSQAPPPWEELPVDMTDLRLWRAVLRRSQARRATGPCGFGVGELKVLPDAALRHLVALCAACAPFGMPDFLMHGRVCVLSKCDCPKAFNDGRPITVLSAIYRLWSSVLSLQLLRLWQHKLPSSIYGGVPGRSARDITFALQHRIKAALLNKEELSGFVLDLTKCFNLLPRPPLGQLLRHLGCPRQLADCWTTSLMRIKRTPCFQGSMHGDITSTTGAPEGDSMSVCAVVALNWLYATMLERFSLSVALFVDNWSWCTDCHEVHTVGLAETCSLVDALRLQVDWAKAFAWATAREGEAWWKQHGGGLLPGSHEIHLLRNARDLGTSMTYRGCQRLGCLSSRLAEGEARLKRLSPEPRSLASKSRLIQTSVWPAAFYGAEGHCIGLARIRRLRSFACRALIGPHSQASPFLALGALGCSVQDPEAYLLAQALRTMQRLSHLHPALYQSVLALAASSTGAPGTVRGPATAFKAILVRNHWSLTEAGLCKAPGNHRLCLSTASRADVARMVTNVWTERVRVEVMHRNGLHGVGVPRPALTGRALAGFTPPQQKVLARHVVGVCFSVYSLTPPLV